MRIAATLFMILLTPPIGCSRPPAGSSTAGDQPSGAQPAAATHPPLTCEQVKELAEDAAGLSAAELEIIATSSTAPKAADLKNQPLTWLAPLCLPTFARGVTPFGLDTEAMRGEFDTDCDQPLTPLKVIEAIQIGQPASRYSVLRSDRVIDCTCDVQGTTATGTISFRAPGILRGKVSYVALWQDGKWQIREFNLPAHRCGTILGSDGQWRIHGLEKLSYDLVPSAIAELLAVPSAKSEVPPQLEIFVAQDGSLREKSDPGKAVSPQQVQQLAAKAVRNSKDAETTTARISAHEGAKMQDVVKTLALCREANVPRVRFWFGGEIAADTDKADGDAQVGASIPIRISVVAGENGQVERLFLNNDAVPDIKQLHARMCDLSKVLDDHPDATRIELHVDPKLRVRAFGDVYKAAALELSDDGPPKYIIRPDRFRIVLLSSALTR